ncbi:hypothetical protein FNH08_29840 [Streptomyces spongiae]|uniref:Uncharacterized protein n=1 Tax=Streptomyces spongiae TaxID=565072 RepID=A0A5N8XP53_9ACTN|nr:hypothetical protein [Streptomyces spongiae]
MRGSLLGTSGFGGGSRGQRGQQGRTLLGGDLRTRAGYTPLLLRALRSLGAYVRAHGMTAAEYRREFGPPRTRALSARSFSRKRRGCASDPPRAEAPARVRAREPDRDVRARRGRSAGCRRSPGPRRPGGRSGGWRRCRRRWRGRRGRGG